MRPATKQVVKKLWNAVAERNRIPKRRPLAPGGNQRAIWRCGLAFMKCQCAYEGTSQQLPPASLPDVLRDAILEPKPEWTA